MPFSDPMAEGPTIQRASERALPRGARRCARCCSWSSGCARSVDVPIVLMGYANNVLAMGERDFAEAAAARAASTA